MTEKSEKENFRTTEHRIVKSNNKEIQPYLEYISDHFGIERNKLDNYKYIFRGKDIYFVIKDWDDDNIALFTRIGVKLGTLDKKDRITFNSQAAQVLEKHITKFIYNINSSEELKNYLTGWLIKDIDIPIGQYVVKYNNWMLGAAVKTKDGLKSRFPRTKRTQKFDF